ncbi:MAG: SUMF1/EgtB/PvdO family nonheme iron enzyme [Planctomycetota bacterium]|jgi:formylglycine-generating enzyme required for sulfatase activity
MKRVWLVVLVISLAAVTGTWKTAAAAEMPTEKEFTNSLGMKFVRIEPGSFMMGSREGGDFDESPIHQVNISRPFYMAATEVTNAQYERFDADHKQMRGTHNISKGDNEAVIYVSWNDAMQFCQWLSRKEGLAYRLATEAEWEYACRAGTNTAYCTGNELPEVYHKSQEREAFPRVADLTAGMTPANPWGLYDMHGNVEEWCLDLYGPYAESEQTDPVGRIDGDFRVTRGGSHNTGVRYLRSANRQGTLPADKHWLIGFRVVLDEMPAGEPLPAPAPELWARNVSQQEHNWSDGPDPRTPYFVGPRNYVKIPPNSKGPLWSRHNHQPAIAACPNGDLLAIWYSTTSEKGRNLMVAASRLRHGSQHWEPASPFWDAPDRNDHGNSLLWDKRDNTMYHFNGLSAAGTWANLALLMRTSTDNGVTWSKARIIHPIHGFRNQVIQGPFITREGYIIVTCDAVPGGGGGSAIHISRDGGKTWRDPGEGRPEPKFAAGSTGAWIAGIHTGCTQLNDGSLLAFGRGDSIEGRMPQSISTDMGENWTYSASDFPPIGGAQRLVLLRLREGPLFFASLAGDGMTLVDAAGQFRQVKGLYGAVSFDEGKTWPARRLITDDKPAHEAQTTNGSEFTMSPTNAEPRGYMAGTQSPDGVIHLISSWNHYAFNLAWLKTAMPARTE